MAFLTYEEIVAALRQGRLLGDCVPEDVESAARAIIAKQVPHYHVVIRDENGVVLDPVCRCAEWKDRPSQLGHFPDCPKYKP